MSVNTQHPAAMRVGGRRLSLPSSHIRPHVPTSPVDEAPRRAASPDDYPRPSAPSSFNQEHMDLESEVEEDEAEAPPQHHVPHHDEEPPRREKKREAHGMHDSERKLRENAQRKMEENRPSKEAWNASGHGAGQRIAQPAGKGFLA
ncbi:uncharacterized protein STEHIDRAFT_170803 [Stereum hirsutum FP-91666 SS1]|uniref:uncharacterized protein n=1 Tax=Stereum hirsutum (strain FP-91666) TaxID=721885 RepID=UPI000444A0BB|nr:uncharacterized protein STEHIDRAFT_170803 [Stereum hirsutum FP-91666 SS1]EIM83553.1 hypothetical protein STEHIDRAFT_170803 [Stereum hirsutum FP-91666 SS1]